MEKYFTNSRFDLMAKLLYLKYYNFQFYIDLYKYHINTFNLAWEHPGKKVNINDFINSFNQLIISFKNNGYLENKPISIGKNGVIINGAHRLVISYYNNITPIFKFSERDGCNSYNYDFFSNRNNYWKRDKSIYPNLDIKYSDTMALEYLNIKSNIRPLIFFPITYQNFEKNKPNILKIFNKYGNIYYFKKIKYKELQLKNLIAESYRGEKWIGGIFPNDSCGGKLKLSYKDDYTLFYLFEFYNLNDAVKMKTEIRNILKFEKHSLHIPDTLEESFRIASCILNINSLSFLNYTLTPKDKDILTNLFKIKNESDLCWDLELNQKINDKDIINNPDKYFYINGYKILNL